MLKILSPTNVVTVLLMGVMLVSVGCARPAAKNEKDKPKKSVMGAETQEIGEAGENAKQADMQVKAKLGGVAMGAYGSAVSKISKMKIKHAVDLFNAAEGRYPKTHEEFMTKVIKANNIKLPVLPGNRSYQYSVEKHELFVVDDDKN